MNQSSWRVNLSLRHSDFCIAFYASCYRIISLDSGRVNTCGAAMFVCAADGLPYALRLVRQRIHIHGRRAHDH